MVTQTDKQTLVNLTRWRLNYSPPPGSLGMIGLKPPRAAFVAPVVVATGDDEDADIQQTTLIPIARRVTLDAMLVLPPVRPGVWLLVEPQVAALYPDRPDLLFPYGRQVDNEMWATHLIVANPAVKDAFTNTEQE